MTRYIQAQGLLFSCQALLAGPGPHTPEWRVDIAAAAALAGHHVAKQVVHAAIAVAGTLLGRLERIIEAGHQHPAVFPERVEGTGTHQRLDRPAIDLARIGTAAKIKQVEERPAAPPGDEQIFDGPLTQALDSAEAIDNLVVRVYREHVLPLVHIGQFQHQLHGPALFHEHHYLVRVLQFRTHHRRHERCGIVGLQPGGLVGHQGVGRGVGFIEAVAGKFFHQVEDLDRQVAVDTLGARALLEYRALLGHLLGLFLAHGAAQHVGAAQGIARQFLGDLHHLLLVQDDAVGGLQDRPQPLVLPLGIGVGDRLPPVLAIDEVVHHARLQRPGAEQRHQGDDVLETVGAQALDQILHAAGFQLEHRGRFRRLQQFETGLVRQRNLGDIQRRLALCLAHRVDHLHRPVDDGQGAQAEKVELDQPGVLHIALVVLGDQAAAGFVAEQW